MRVYYNDSEPFVCEWLRNLIREKLLPEGDVDERPIQQVSAADVRGYDQCHFFAGIGGWACALELAGWGGRPVWTGSCPCQPFSAAGKGKAEDDPRHLWPYWFRLIRECRPERVFGEQVANGVGKGWFDVVSTDLEEEAYTVGAAVLGAHSVTAPHIRPRLWFVAALDDTTSTRRIPSGLGSKGEAWHEARMRGPERGRAISRLADSGGSSAPRLGEHGRAGPGPEMEGLAGGGRLGDSSDTGLQGSESPDLRPAGRRQEGRVVAGAGAAPWDAPTWLPCRDGKARPIESGLEPLAHGVPQRVGRLRGYGNAIVPQTAAAFVSAYLEALAVAS